MRTRPRGGVYRSAKGWERHAELVQSRRLCVSGKITFIARSDAEEFVASDRGEHDAQRIYDCSLCGWMHTTSGGGSQRYFDPRAKRVNKSRLYASKQLPRLGQCRVVAQSVKQGWIEFEDGNGRIRRWSTVGWRRLMRPYEP